MSEEKKPTPSTNIPLLSYQKSEQKRLQNFVPKSSSNCRKKSRNTTGSKFWRVKIIGQHFLCRCFPNFSMKSQIFKLIALKELITYQTSRSAFTQNAATRLQLRSSKSLKEQFWTNSFWRKTFVRIFYFESRLNSCT